MCFLRRYDSDIGVKNYQAPTASMENTIQKYQNFLYTFLILLCDYGLNSCRYF